MLSSTASFDTAFGTASISHRRSSTESISSSSTDTLTDGSSDAELPATSSKPYSPSFAVKQTRQAKDWRPKATLHLRRDDSTRTFFERLVTRALMTDEYHELKPLNLDRGPIPVHPVAKEHAWILSRAFVALALQQLSYWVFPNFKWPVYVAYPIYLICFAEFALACVHRFGHYAGIYGTLDEKNVGRDRIPDASIPQLAKGFLAYLILRTAGEFALKWDPTEQPLQSFSLYTPLRFFAWLITMDYFFYVYHRSSHEVSWLWWIHSKHHTTKHPNPVLSIIADEYQEVIEIALVPLCATLLIPMSFHELFLLSCYTTYVEIFGHSGIRADWSLPITGPILNLIGCELIIEDHDLHHRLGRSGKNYGKQTRVWDVLFGTTGRRQEMRGMKGHRVE